MSVEFSLWHLEQDAYSCDVILIYAIAIQDRVSCGRERWQLVSGKIP